MLRHGNSENIWNGNSGAGVFFDYVLCLAFTIFNRACFLFAVVMFCALIAMHKNITFKDMAVLYSLSLIISYPLGLICQLRDIGGAVHNTVGIFYIVICLVLPWTADAGAYFIGSAMGKHKLCPNISLRKVWRARRRRYYFCTLHGGCLLDFPVLDFPGRRLKSIILL